MTSSIKPEVHKLPQCRQRKIEPWPQAICTKHFVKIGPVVPEICSWTEKQTHRQTDHNTPLSYRGAVTMKEATCVKWIRYFSTIFWCNFCKSAQVSHCAQDSAQMSHYDWTTSSAPSLAIIRTYPKTHLFPHSFTWLHVQCLQTVDK